MNATQKLTPWFPADVKPVRSGWYENKGPLGQAFKLRWWFDVKTGKWLGGPDGFVCFQQDREWRGLASDQSTPAPQAGRRPGMCDLILQVRSEHKSWPGSRVVAEAKLRFHQQRMGAK